MFIKRLISVLLVLMFCASPARAQQSCQMLNELLSTISVVRDIQSDPKDRRLMHNISDLQRQISKVSLPAIIPMQAQSQFLIERKALSLYTSSIREAVAGAQSGYNDYAKQALGEAITPDIVQTLSSLDAYWGCSIAESNEPEQINEQHKGAQYFGSGNRSPNANVNAADSSTLDKSDREEALTSSGTLSHVAANPVQFRRASMVFIAVVLILAAIASLVYVRFRNKRFEVREVRRLISLPVLVKLENKSHSMIIMDISMNGMKLKHDTAIDSHLKLQIQLGGIWHIGHIKWSNKFFAGVMFKKPIDADTLKQITESSLTS